MTGARSVTSNQDSIHNDLEKLVQKYASTSFLRPIADHTRKTFSEASKFVNQFYGIVEATPRTPVQVILDSGCGTGESTLHISKRFQGVPVIGIDKSSLRLQKAEAGTEDIHKAAPTNAFYARGELLDFWKLAEKAVAEGRWTIPYHALFFPNPWPKQSEATRRFHLHPIFPTMLPLAKTTELRTNWEIYAREFAKAAETLASVKNFDLQVELTEYNPDAPETAFERKYKEARQQLWRVIVNFNR